MLQVEIDIQCGECLAVYQVTAVLEGTMGFCQACESQLPIVRIMPTVRESRPGWLARVFGWFFRRDW